VRYRLFNEHIDAFGHQLERHIKMRVSRDRDSGNINLREAVCENAARLAPEFARQGGASAGVIINYI
jgi:hypothetical protein